MAKCFWTYGWSGRAGYTAGLTELNLTGTTTFYGSVFYFTKADTITHIGIHFKSNTGTACRHKVAVCLWDGSNYEGTTTILSSGNAWGHFTPSGFSSNTYQEIALNAGVDVIPGYRFSVRVFPDPTEAEITAGRPNVSNYSKFGFRIMGGSGFNTNAVNNMQLMYNSDPSGSVTTVVDHGGTLPSILCKGASRYYGGGIKLTNWEGNNIISGQTGANKFSISSTVAKTYKVSGLTLQTRSNASNLNTFTVEFYNGGEVTDTTPVASTSVGGYHIHAGMYDYYPSRVIYFDDPISCVGDEIYRIGLKQTGNSPGARYADVVYPETFMGYGVNCSLSIRSTGNWTDYSNRLCSVFPIITDVAAPTGGGLTGKFNLGFN